MCCCCSKTVTPVDYHVAVAGQEPDPLFVQEPDSDAINKAIEEEAGLKVSETECNDMTLEGNSQQHEKSKITGAIKDAYLKANPQVTSDQISVTNVQLNNKYVTVIISVLC